MENNKTQEKKSKTSVFFKSVVVFFIIVILGCSAYLLNSFRLVKKYDVDKFKLGKFEVTTLNGVLKKNRKLVYASEKKGVVTLKYDIKSMSLNNVYEYLEELSSEGYTVVNLEELYMRIVSFKDDIQIRIKIGENHLVFEYNIGIDYDEKDSEEKEKEDQEKSDKEKKDSKDESKIESNS